MQIVPVLDVRGGRAVRAVAGRRAEYRPLEPSADPLVVARSYRDRLGHPEMYLADLDAIVDAAAEPAWDLFARLHDCGFVLWVDAGVREAERATRLVAAGVATVVVGLETVAGPQALAAIVQRWPERVVFSLDLRDGLPLAAGWPRADAEEIAAEAVAQGVRRLLVLDLARVGVGTGTGTEALLAGLHAAYPEVELYAGGGVRGPDDLDRLAAAGATGVLVASALHDGRLGPLRPGGAHVVDATK